MVEIESFPHRGKEQTGRMMYHFAENYCRDLGPSRFARLPSWYAEVSRIPYQSDDELFPSEAGEVVEVVARPRHLLDRSIWPALDCKKKAILIGAWAACNAVPFAFVAVSENPDKVIHHVLPFLFLGGEWVSADATLPEYSLGQVFPFTKAEELTR